MPDAFVDLGVPLVLSWAYLHSTWLSAGSI